jgi:hypothetical protein
MGVYVDAQDKFVPSLKQRECETKISQQSTGRNVGAAQGYEEIETIIGGCCGFSRDYDSSPAVVYRSILLLWAESGTMRKTYNW